MSSEPDDSSNYIVSVDVNKDPEEKDISPEINSDTGISSINSFSLTYTPGADILISTTNCISDTENPIDSGHNENESESLLSIPMSSSPDNKELAEVIVNNSFEKELPVSEKEDQNTTNPLKTKEILCHNDICVPAIGMKPDLRNEDPVQDKEFVVNCSDSEEYCKNVNTKAISLSNNINDDIILPSTNETITKTETTIIETSENISKETEKNNEINADEILSEFSSKKNKVTAVQKIPEQMHTDRYARIPIELIPQDLGSIVKNVHGIFSTVSGSLKNAYNNSHRMSQKGPSKQVVRPLPNGNVINYIFDGELAEEKSPIKENGISKSNDNQDLQNENKPDGEQNKVENEDSNKDMVQLQRESLELILAEQKRENMLLKDRLKQQMDENQEKDVGFKEMEKKMELMAKRVEQAEREKDAAVMRYASVECAGIEARRQAEKAMAAEKAALAEMELINGKLKSAHGEKHRICQLYDDKCHELSMSEQEIAKVREELRNVEGRLKWTQSKLRLEMDAFKESTEKIEKLNQQVSELEAAKEAAINSSTDIAKAKQLEADLVESQAALIMCRHDKQELEKRLTAVSQQFDSCVRERDSATASLASSTAEVERLKVSNLRLEEEAAELAALRARAALADALTAQLERESERSTRAESALSEALAASETCRQREAAALAHAASLTTSHVRDRAHSTELHHQVLALTADNTSLRERVTALEAECDKLKTALSEETDRRNKENKVLARKVAELTEELSEANKTLEWEKGENCVLKKKHASAIKELNRELHRTLKRCEQLEAKLPSPEATSTRTGSVTSLSSTESAPQEDGRIQNGHENLPDIQIKDPNTFDKYLNKVREPDRQALIERIVSLQRAAARRSERCEFLEEHSKQLTGELRAKSKLLRHLLCSLPAGAVASQDRDANKKEIARLGGGAMAAVWGGDPGGMSLELSLEMNTRLQAVLEDALLKNITLKENMDTLGAEISRLKAQKPNAESKNSLKH